ncbi:MAG: long-chain fatty acid--CoA ligase [Candidatus Longimicrobiales bacterium M2_2A_002]
MSDARAKLRAELLDLFRAGADSPLPDDRFDALARRVFAHNVAAVPAYRTYCEARGRGPDAIGRWTEIPAVPTAAFKELALRDATAETERVFRTSGTTRGSERRGEHHVPDLALYRASLRATFEAYLLPDGARPVILSLMPPARALPDSSLAFMISDVMAAFGAPGSRALADADGLDYGALDEAVARAVDASDVVMLLGTSSAFIHWLDRMAEAGRSFPLPSGSRLMDTGGYKGRGRRLEPAELRAVYGARLGLEPWACVNEYGMTELLSQYYDIGLRARLAGDGPAPEVVGVKRGPGWLRSVAVDPETLDPLPAGETGLLRHVDLANLNSVAAVQTEDLGRVANGAVVLEGRAAGAPPRGCSIAMDLLLENAP